MKRVYYTMVLFFLTLGVANATPALTKFQVLAQFLQSSKIKVYNGGPTEFIANIGASRGVNGSTYETVEMEVVFYTTVNFTNHDLKTITIKSSDFEYAYLKFYNEEQGRPPAMNNNVVISIPEEYNTGSIQVKYRWKDANGTWQPTGSGGSYTVLSGVSYQTINLSPPAVKMPIYLVFHKGGGANDIGQLLTTSNVPTGWSNAGVAFKLYTDQNSVNQFGTVPTYQYRYRVYDSNSQIGDPEEVFFYSTSNNFTPTALAGYTYELQSKTTLFYAFQTQVANTVAILECRHKSAPIVIYKSSESDINLDMYDTSVAFYAYRYGQ